MQNPPNSGATKRPEISRENRVALSRYCVVAALSAVVAIAAFSAFGLVLAGYFRFEADRAGTENRAKERLADLTRLASEREKILAKSYADKENALKSVLDGGEKRRKDMPAETFSFSRIRLVHRGVSYPALVYQPHPETKAEHFQPGCAAEVIAPRIEGLAYGDGVAIESDPRQVAWQWSRWAG